MVADIFFGTSLVGWVEKFSALFFQVSIVESALHRTRWHFSEVVETKILEICNIVRHTTLNFPVVRGSGTVGVSKSH